MVCLICKYRQVVTAESAHDVRQNGVMTNSPETMRSSYLRWGNVGLVFLGGSLGVFAREGLMLALPGAGAQYFAVLLANVFGALLLGFLLAGMGQGGGGGRQSIRLLLGTGALGGFTTYSALAQAVLVLWSGGAAWLAVGYAGGTLLFGGISTWCGVLLGGALKSRSRGQKQGQGRDQVQGRSQGRLCRMRARSDRG